MRKFAAIMLLSMALITVEKIDYVSVDSSGFSVQMDQSDDDDQEGDLSCTV